MEASGITENTQPVQGVTDAPKTTTETKPEAGATGFEGFLKQFLPNKEGKQISEEELFSAVVRERIQASKGDKAAGEYAAELEKQIGSMKKADGYIPYEDAAKNALRSLVASGTITKEEGDKIYSQSFAASQLDDNKDVLFDDRGGADDPTMAVMAFEQAMMKAKEMVDATDADASTLTMRSLDEETMSKAAILAGGFVSSSSSFVPSGVSESGNPVDGAGGFLFKPISDSTGKLAILSPEALVGQVESVVLKTLNDEEIEKGTYSGNGNGGRDHYRFTKPGGSYPKELIVEMQLKDGSVKRYEITDSSKRWD